MSDNNITKLPFLVKDSADAEKSFKKRSQENHFFLETFLSYQQAKDYVDDCIDMFNKEDYYVGLLEIRNINGGYQAGVSIFKRQGDLFD